MVIIQVATHLKVYKIGEKMTPDEIQGLLQLPVIAILIYLLYRENGQKEKLLAQLLLQAEKHSRDLVEMACHGYITQSAEENKNK